MKIILLTFFIAVSSLSFCQTAKSNLAFGDNSERVIRFYPNPAVNIINFEFQNATDKGYSLWIFNFVGKKVLEITSVTDKTTVPLTDFFRGVYIFQLRDKTGRLVESGKFHVSK
jgi:hypothetical protein